MRTIQPSTALISVSDKTALDNLAPVLAEQNITIYATSGTARWLESTHNTPAKSIDTLTRYPEMLDGLLKTLQPGVHAGILADRHRHVEELQQYQLPWIDLVICNLYPFAQKAQETDDLEELTSYIDIGGPTMLRAAAKNHQYVTVICDPTDYPKLIQALQEQGVDYQWRRQLAAKAFDHTVQYDSLIAQKLASSHSEQALKPPQQLTTSWQLKQTLRYGENPHQQGYLYQSLADSSSYGTWTDYQISGNTLSYNNILDSHQATRMLSEFTMPVCIIVKHGNACGAAEADNISTAFINAWNSDPQAAYGSIVAVNRAIDQDLANTISQHFIEVLIAPDFQQQALTILQRKTRLRLIKLPEHLISARDKWQYRVLDHQLLLQNDDSQLLRADELKQVTHKPLPTDLVNTGLTLWRVLKHLHSNAVIIGHDRHSSGIGAAMVSRIDAIDLAIQKADHYQPSIMVSDGFLPFGDNIDRLNNTNVVAVIQPGGSKNDQYVIQACNNLGIAMAFTSKRCFSH